MKYRQENTSAAVISTAPRQASPALSGPASKSIPITTPRTGRKPANQYVESARYVLMTRKRSMTATDAETQTTTESRTRRRVENSGRAARIAAATSGTVTDRAWSWSISPWLC